MSWYHHSLYIDNAEKENRDPAEFVLGGGFWNSHVVIIPVVQGSLPLFRTAVSMINDNWQFGLRGRRVPSFRGPGHSYPSVNECLVVGYQRNGFDGNSLTITIYVKRPLTIKYERYNTSIKLIDSPV